jgi:hypothetical protein
LQLQLLHTCHASWQACMHAQPCLLLSKSALLLLLLKHAGNSST